LFLLLIMIKIGLVSSSRFMLGVAQFLNNFDFLHYFEIPKWTSSQQF
jgi:hypothetical protein